jgi:multiple sugar transport system substrate-binding protein
MRFAISLPKFLLVLSLVLAACLMAGRGRAVSDVTVIRFWTMGREGEVIKDFVDEFERTHQGIRIDIQQLPWASAHEKLMTAFAGDASPDICQLGNTWIPEFVALGALESLDDRAAASSAISKEDYFPGIWDSNRVDNRLYGIPWYVDTRLIFYRKDILAAAGYAAPPKDWDEWKRAMAAVKTAVGQDNFAVLLPTDEFEPLLALALQQDEPLLRANGRWGNFRSAGFRRALQFYNEAFQRNWAPRLATGQVSNVWNEFGRGYYSFYISGPWNIGEFKRRLPPDLQDRWMTAALPGPNGPGASIAGGASFAIFRSSRHKDIAWQLVEFLSRVDIQRRLFHAIGDLPPRRSAWDDPTLAGDIYARAFRDQLERVKSPPKVAEWARIATEMRLVAEVMVHGGLTVDEAARELDARVDRILEKRRWMLDHGHMP